MPFITMNAGNSMYEHTNFICRELGFQPNIVLQSEDPFYIRKCIELGLGIAIAPELSWRGQFSGAVSLKQIGRYTRKTYVYKKRITEEAVSLFVDTLMKEFKN